MYEVMRRSILLQIFEFLGMEVSGSGEGCFLFFHVLGVDGC
jgi:hypothetical protein